MLLRVEKSSPDSQECVIVGWRSSSSGRVPAEQAQSLELKPQHHKKKKREKKKKEYVIASSQCKRNIIITLKNITQLCIESAI
jgi:hypothetical protein